MTHPAEEAAGSAEQSAEPEQPRSEVQRDSLGRRLRFALLAVALALVAIEGVLSWGYAFTKSWERANARPRPEEAHARHDPELGWANLKSHVSRDLYGPGKHFTSNALGIRALEDYGAAPTQGRRRVVFAGDSFTMGFGVGDADTYPAQIERLEPRVQSVNLGTGAYGADQAFLSYLRDGAPLDPDLVVFAFIAHDMRRMELDFYMAPKPRLALEGDRLVVENQPVPEHDRSELALRLIRELGYALDLGKLLSKLAGSLGTIADAQREAVTARELSFAPVAEKMFEELAALAAREDRGLLLVYLPVRLELATGPQPVCDWAARVAAERDIAFVDLTPAFALRDLSPLFGLNDHYSEGGNALVAETLLPEIRRQLQLAAPGALAPAS